MTLIFSFDIGTNSIGSCGWDTNTAEFVTGLSIFPEGIERDKGKRGESKNVKRRQARQARVCNRRASKRKRHLRRILTESGLLPRSQSEFQQLLEETNPWLLRRLGLDRPLMPMEFGRVLLHIANGRGAVLAATADGDASDKKADDGKVKAAIHSVHKEMRQRNARTFGELMAMLYEDRAVLASGGDEGNGKCVYRDPIRNRAASYERCADRSMILAEFLALWGQQRGFNSGLAKLLTDDLLRSLYDERGDAVWKTKGAIFGQRRHTWDVGTLGRCDLHPSDRWIPQADMYASRFLMVQFVNNLRIEETGKTPRALTPQERWNILDCLGGPLGTEIPRKSKKNPNPVERPKATVTIGDLRELMGWPRIAGKCPQFRFTIEADENRKVETDWFSREIIHGVFTAEVWASLPAGVKEDVNREILKRDPDDESDAQKLEMNALAWTGISREQADKLVAAWRNRPNIEKRLRFSRRAVRNLLSVMENGFTTIEGGLDLFRLGGDAFDPFSHRWLTPIEARKLIAADPSFRDVTSGRQFDKQTQDRYSVGHGGPTSRERKFMRTHQLLDDGTPKPPPPPKVSNPVVQKALGELRKHLIALLRHFGRKPDMVIIELARSAAMTKKQADKHLKISGMRNKIRQQIINEYDLKRESVTQERAAISRVLLAVQQSCRCPLCGKPLYPGSDEEQALENAARGVDVEESHIIPAAHGGSTAFGNLVLAHTACNRNMGERTPRELWGDQFQERMADLEEIYSAALHQKKVAKSGQLSPGSNSGPQYWIQHFSKRETAAKLKQFKREEIDGMTAAQLVATQHATRAAMSYIANSLYDGQGLPERGGKQRVFATRGEWTSRIRNEFNLYFDPSERNIPGGATFQGKQGQVKDRDDHRHHAIDAIAICISTLDMQKRWGEREAKAESWLRRNNQNPADARLLANYRKNNPLKPPKPFKSREQLREAVRQSVYGKDGEERPVCHRPAKRKIVGALHQETIVRRAPSFKGKPCAFRRIFVAGSTPNDGLKLKHLGRDWIIFRKRPGKAEVALAGRSLLGGSQQFDETPPGKGIVASRNTRLRLCECLREAAFAAGITDLTKLTDKDVQRFAKEGAFRHKNGRPIKSVRLRFTQSYSVEIKPSDKKLRRMFGPDFDSLPVKEKQKLIDQHTRLYAPASNHHVEILEYTWKRKWKGIVVTSFEAANRNRKQNNAIRRLLRGYGIPSTKHLSKVRGRVRQEIQDKIADIKRQFAIVDTRPKNSAEFVMSLCEGEMVRLRERGSSLYYVVAKIDNASNGQPNITLVPHQDARSAGGVKEGGEIVQGSSRDCIAATPEKLRTMKAEKVEVDVLGRVKVVEPRKKSQVQWYGDDSFVDGECKKIAAIDSGDLVQRELF